MSRLVRWTGIVSVGLRRAATRAIRTNRQRVALSIFGVVVAICLLVVVTGIGMGLAAGTTVHDDEIDYWIVTEAQGTESPLVSMDGPQFGSVHETTDHIIAIDGVESATPVLSQIFLIESNERNEYILIFGIIDHSGLESVLGLDTAALTPGDPYYSSDEPTDEIVLSRSAANLLDINEGESVAIRGQEFTVIDISDRSGGTASTVPTAIVQLSELQQITGADEYDQADQFVVKTETPAVKSELEGIYPESSVYSRSEMIVSQTIDSDLTIALSLTAFIISVVIGTLFVVTTMGLEIVADKQNLATLSAMGLSLRSQLGIIGMQVATTVCIGGLIGGVTGLGVIKLVNAIAMITRTDEPIALFHPLLGVYGAGVSVVIAVISILYLLVLTKRLSGGVPSQ